MRTIPVSQYSVQPIGILVEEEGEPTDADGDVQLTITRVADASFVVQNAVATNDPEGDGLYSYRVGTIVTSEQGDYTVDWVYEVNGTTRHFADGFWVTTPMPYWDSLDSGQKQIVENVYHRISNMFDSTVNHGGGGPYLWEVPQSKFGYETIARLMVTEAMNYLNYTFQPVFVPPFQVGVGVQNAFPPGFYGLLETATAWALYKHLSLSYLEQPDVEGVPTARLDRRKYSAAWAQKADEEKETLDKMLKQFKRKYMTGLNSRALLVAGGLFPLSYLDPSRPRWPYVASRW